MGNIRNDDKKMAKYQDLIVSSREKAAAVRAMDKAFDVMDIIMMHDLIRSQAGYAWTSNDTDILVAGRKALDRWVPEPETQAQCIMNESALEQAGRAINLADMLLRRQGFDDFRSAGDDTLDGDVFNDAMKRTVERAYEKWMDITQHSRN